MKSITVLCRDHSILKLPCSKVWEGAGQDLFLLLNSCMFTEICGSARRNGAELSTNLLTCRSFLYLSGRLSKELGKMKEERLKALGWWAPSVSDWKMPCCSGKKILIHCGFHKTVFGSLIDVWMFLVRHPLWIWIFYFWSTFKVVAEDIFPSQVKLTQDMNTVPSKTKNLSYFWEYFKGFCWIVLRRLWRDPAAWKEICLARLCLGSIAVAFTLAICQAWFDFLRKLPDPSTAILCLAEMLLCLLDDSTSDEQLLLISPISLIRFCFVLFWLFIIILVDCTGIWILVSLVSENRNIIARVLFSGWLEVGCFG